MPEILYMPMIYIRLHTTDPYYNLAVEEFLLRHSDEDVFMLWQNEPTVVIGKNQNAYAEVNLDYAKEHKIPYSSLRKRLKTICTHEKIHPQYQKKIKATWVWHKVLLVIFVTLSKVKML